MNINHIRYFEEVCKTGSVTKAANECYISQPSITSAINSLEKELGYKPKVIATGGLAESIVPYCTNKIITDDELLLNGLMLIYQKNI